MRFKRWKNPYIELVGTLPEIILAVRDGDFSAEQLLLLEAKKSRFARVYAELGSGSGGHLIEQALRRPEALYIGFELRFKRTYRAAEKAAARGLDNLLVVCTKAQRIKEIFSPESLDGIYVNFPDPWSKRRWLKHRLLDRHFLKTLHQLLKPGGIISYKTDAHDYFRQTLETAEESGLWSITKLTYDLASSAFAAENISSEFEKLFLSKHIPVCMTEFAKQKFSDNMA